MSYGMSYDDYWNGDPVMAKYYSDKALFDMKQRNYEMWLQGRYIYDAIGRLREALLPFVKDPKVLPYVEDPYPLTEEEYQAQEEKKAREEQENIRKMMMNLAQRKGAR